MIGTVIERNLGFKVVAVLAMSLALLVHADETISSNMTLTADADWRDKGVVTIPAGVTVNLNGHSLKLAGLVGEGTIYNPFIDLTVPDPARASTTTMLSSGTSAANAFNNNFLRNGMDATCRILVNPNDMPLVIDYDFGAGNEQVVDMYKVHCGNMAGCSPRCPKAWTFSASNDKTSWVELDVRTDEPAWTQSDSGTECRTKMFANATAYRYYRFVVTKIQSSSATEYLELIQLEYFNSRQSELWLDVPEGDTLDNSRVAIKGGIRLVKDGKGTFVAAKAGQGYRGGTRIVAGTLACGGMDTNLLGTGTTIQVEAGATFDDNGCKNLQSYEIVLAGGTLADVVSGQLTMRMDREGNYEVQNGATLNLAERTDVLNTCSSAYLTFAPNAAITLNLAGRTPALGEKLVRWTAKTRPRDAVFAFDGETAQQGISPVATDTGLFYGVDANSTLAEHAVWTGAGNDGNVANPANWSCTNVAGNPIENGLPGTITTVSVTGLINIQIPVGTSFAHEEIHFSDCRLDANSDWRGLGTLTLADGDEIDLNGHSLKLAGVSGSGTIDSTLTDLTVPDPARVSTTTVLSGGTSAANAFNNNFLRKGGDAACRILVHPDDMPLVIDYDFGEGNEQVVDMYKVHCGNMAGCSPRCPKAWALSASNDKTSWVELDACTDEPAWTQSDSGAECRTKMFANATAYRYYRFVVTKIQSSSVTEYLELIQLEYFSTHKEELWLDIPANLVVTNSGVAIKGGIRLAKDGKGTYVAAKAGQEYSGGTQIVAGTLACGGMDTNLLGVGDTIQVEAGATFDDNGCKNLQSYEIVLAGGKLADVVSGWLTMRMDRYGNYEIQDGATLDMSGRADVLNVANVDSGYSLTFASDAAITLNLAGRTPMLGEKLVRWTAKTRSADAVFTFDGETAQQGISPVITDTGIFYGVDADSTLAEHALWTGAGNDGNVANPANWACTNVAGNPIENGLPSAITTVSFAGSTDIQLLPGTEFTCEEIRFADCRLGADCDWRGLGTLTLVDGVDINLNGHSLKLAGIAGEGTISNPLIDLTVPEPARASTTTVLSGGTSAANAFNNNFLRNGGDASRRILVHPDDMPLVVDYDFGAGNEQVVDMYKVHCGNMAGCSLRCPKAWTLSASNDKTSWVELDACTDEPAWTQSDSGAECRTKMFANATAYRYYRFVVTKIQSSSATEYLELIQLEYFNSHQSELWLDIPEGDMFANSSVAINGGIRLVKDGKGTYVAAKAGQGYCGGTRIVEGTMVCGGGMGAELAGLGGVVQIDSGSTFDVKGWKYLYPYCIVLAGGALANVGDPLANENAQVSKLTLLENSSLKVTSSYGFASDAGKVKGGKPVAIDLGGRTLEVTIDPDCEYRLRNAEVKNGTIKMMGAEGSVRFFDTGVRAPTADFDLDAELLVHCPISVHNLTLAASSFTTLAASPITVAGTFKTSTLSFPDVVLLDGATLDLREQSGPFAVESVSPAARGLTFAEGARVFVDLRGRSGVNGQYVVTWEQAPENFRTMKFVSVERIRYSLLADQNGVMASSGVYIFIR